MLARGYSDLAEFKKASKYSKYEFQFGLSLSLTLFLSLFLCLSVVYLYLSIYHSFSYFLCIKKYNCLQFSPCLTFEVVPWDDDSPVRTKVYWGRSRAGQIHWPPFCTCKCTMIMRKSLRRWPFRLFHVYVFAYLRLYCLLALFKQIDLT